MGIVYGVVNQKGGVGKTTTAVNVAAYLAQAGRKVLLIDLDPQGNATSGVGIDKGRVGGRQDGRTPSTYDVLVNEASVRDSVLHTSLPGLDVVPSNIDLAGAEPDLVSVISREGVLRRAIEPVRAEYDYVLIDAPPSLGLLTINALAASDSTIIPIQCEYYALEGVSELMKTMDMVRRYLNPTLKIGLVVLTMYDNRVRLAQQVVAEVRQAFREKVARTVVPRNVRLSEAPSHGLPVALYDPRSRGALAYKEIAQEVLAHG